MRLSVAITAYALLWISFGLGHSLLARNAARRRMVAWIGAYERLAYNLISALHVGLVLASGQWLLGGFNNFTLGANVDYIFVLIELVGALGIILSLRGYDLGRFLGVTQLIKRTNEHSEVTIEPFVTTGFNRYVRHPLYLASIILLIGRATDLLGLTTAIFATLYFVRGLRFEERKLLRIYGPRYATYCKSTPALIPFTKRR